MIRKSITAIAGLVAAVAMISASAGSAEAQGCGYGGYYGGGHYGGGYGRGISVSVGRGYGGYYGGYGRGISVNYYRPSFYGGYSQGPVWHNTSHLHYHRGAVVPHGNHYDVYPGHYHMHRSGHWDW